MNTIFADKRLGQQYGWVTATLLLVLSVALSPAFAADLDVTDQAITDAVEDELLHDAAVASSYIDVQTSNGIVTLSGAVSNLMAKERAGRLAETVKGARSVINSLDVKMAQDIPDEALRQDVNTLLTLDSVSDIQDINIRIADGVVTLTGTVQSWPEKQAAARVAKAVRGVKAVQNNIDIRYPDRRPDSEIEAGIIHRLRWDAYVDHALIDVQVQNGKVILSGAVGSVAEKRRAIANAGISGVTDIDGAGLEVKTWARTPEFRENKYVVKSDEELRQAIEALFREAPRVKAYRVAPDVADGVVTLRGTVDNLKAKQAAARVAQRTVGVKRVINRLKVRTANTAIRGDTLESDIRGALTRDPYIHRYKISVDVVDGVVHLYGAVNSFFEKYRAEDVAAQVKGVGAIENHLRSLENARPYVSNPYVDDEWDADDDIRDVYTPRMTLKPDGRIKEDIVEELRWSPFVNADEVTVSVVNGIATLDGAVESESERRAALENAYEGGAMRVISQIEVK